MRMKEQRVGTETGSPSLREILKRVEKADAPYRKLDVLINRAALDEGSATPVTSSISAAVNLIEHVLPGWAWKVGKCSVSDDAWLVPDLNCPVHGARLREQFHDITAGSIWDNGVDIDRRPAGQPALALCQALLTALVALEERGVLPATTGDIVG